MAAAGVPSQQVQEGGGGVATAQEGQVPAQEGKPGQEGKEKAAGVAAGGVPSQQVQEGKPGQPGKGGGGVATAQEGQVPAQEGKPGQPGKGGGGGGVPSQQAQVARLARQERVVELKPRVVHLRNGKGGTSGMTHGGRKEVSGSGVPPNGRPNGIGRTTMPLGRSLFEACIFLKSLC